jgi:hypothetical protein
MDPLAAVNSRIDELDLQNIISMPSSAEKNILIDEYHKLIALRNTLQVPG